MDFALSDEQQMLQESARRFFAERHPLARARQALPWSDQSQQALWQDMADMGWLGLLAPEAQGGLELGMCEAYLVAEAAGRQLLNLPLAASAVLLPLLLRESSGDNSELARWVEALAAGRSAFHASFESVQTLDHAQQCSQQLLVYGLQTQHGALQLAALPSPDETTASSTALDPTLRCAPLAGVAGTSPALDWKSLQISQAGRQQALAGFRLARVAELLGAAAASLDLACDYARQREQFGKAIGSYQGIKHPLANAWMALDNARLCALYAAAALDGKRADWQFSCAAAELTAMEGAQQVAHTTLQVHGGLGFTWEHDAHLYLKRIQHVSLRLGGSEAACNRLEQITCAVTSA